MNNDDFPSSLLSNIQSGPTPLERLAAAEADLHAVTELIERLWVERHLLYGALRELKIIKRNVELARARLSRIAP